jgi:hypothetical protein
MDLHRALRDLYEELRKLNEVIASLEHFATTGTMLSPPQHGRKSMSEDERQRVSERMKKYWEGRRNQKGA